MECSLETPPKKSTEHGFEPPTLSEVLENGHFTFRQLENVVENSHYRPNGYSTTKLLVHHLKETSYAESTDDIISVCDIIYCPNIISAI
jgi:hypothetical protein